MVSEVGFLKRALNLKIDTGADCNVMDVGTFELVSDGITGMSPCN
jgi:hypothetical protein